MKKFNRLLLTSFAASALMFSLSICSHAAQIDSLSVVDNTVYASVSEENVTFYAAEYDEGLLVDAFFTESKAGGYIELPLGEAFEYKIYLWDKESLAPLSSAYTLTEGKAYPEGSTTPVPEYDFSEYSFNQEDDVMIVSSLSETEIRGFKAGVETVYPLTDNVTVLGLSDSVADICAGSVVLIGTNRNGDCSAIELLASMGIPVNPEGFEAQFGVYEPSDKTGKYRNVVTEMYSKSGDVLTDKTETAYKFSSPSTICYRVGIAMDGETPLISCNGNKVCSYPTIFENTAYYHNYLYLRYNTETERVTQCVYYCVPKNFDPGAGDGEYSDIFSLDPVVVIK